MAPPDGFLPYGRTPTQADNTRDLGTSTQRWRTLYLGTSLILQGATYKHTLVGATPSANRTITFPDASGTVALLGASQSFTEAVTIAPAASTSGVRTALTVTGAADTGRTASTEQSDLYVNLGRTVTWATGAITNQRFTRFAAPTIAFVGASTVTNTATVYIDNAPQAGANATLTNAYALWVDAGATRLDGAVTMGSTLEVTGVATLSSAPRVPSVGDSNGNTALGIGAQANAVNYVQVTNAPTGNSAAVSVEGSDTNIGVDIAPKGTGALTLRSGGGTARVQANNTGLGFFGATPAAQPTAVADAAGGATVDTEARAALNALLARLRTLGIIAT